MQNTCLKPLFWISLVLTLLSGAALAVIDPYLRIPTSPIGIVSYEFCGFQDSCRSMVEAWSPYQQLMTALSLGVDYLFMLVYPATICFALLLVAQQLSPRLQRSTRIVAWSAWVAGVADALENYCLAQMLLAPDVTGYAWPASMFATVKFTFVGITLLWLLVAYLASILPQPKAGMARLR